MELKYKSIFKDDINRLIMYENAMNFKNTSKIDLYDLDNYFIHIKKNKKTLTEDEFKNYIYDYKFSKLSEYKRYLIILKFSKFLIRFGNTNIFFEEIKFNNTSNFEPHIYNELEMKKILLNIDKRKYYNVNFKYVYPVLFRLLFSTGMRISEALSLKYKDIDLDDDSINIILSKENISRKIYISDSMKNVFVKFFNLMSFENDDILFKTTQVNALYVFKQVVNDVNIKANEIRVHDIRHSFAVMSLEKMIKNNIEPEEALLYLEKYMGHSNILSTEYYLHMTDNMKKDIINTMKNYMPDLYPDIKEGVDNE